MPYKGLSDKPLVGRLTVDDDDDDDMNDAYIIALRGAMLSLGKQFTLPELKAKYVQLSGLASMAEDKAIAAVMATMASFTALTITVLENTDTASVPKGKDGANLDLYR